VTHEAAQVDARLAEHGALLFRGFAVRDADDFSRVVSALPYQKLDYIYHSTLHGNGVRATFIGAAIKFPWQPGDVLALDNLQFAHGRESYKGERKVLAALLDPGSESSQVDAVRENAASNGAGDLRNRICGP
jgi:hypothetical protein